MNGKQVSSTKKTPVYCKQKKNRNLLSNILFLPFNEINFTLHSIKFASFNIILYAVIIKK